jgi:hypothetical protein
MSEKKTFIIIFSTALVVIFFLLFQLNSKNNKLKQISHQSELLKLYEKLINFSEKELEPLENTYKEKYDTTQIFPYMTLKNNIQSTLKEIIEANHSLHLSEKEKSSLDSISKLYLRLYVKLTQKLNYVTDSLSDSLFVVHTLINQKDSLITLQVKQQDSLEEKIQKLNFELKNTGHLLFQTQNGTTVNYLGEIKDNKAHGFGIAIMESGNRYEGEWLEGKKDGSGTYIYKNGEKFVGRFENDKRNGLGSYHWLNGDVYNGGWKNDKRDGQGEIVDKSGKITKSGTWSEDKLLE